MQDGCVGRGGYSHAAATWIQTGRFRFVALDMISSKDIAGAAFSAPVTKPKPCEKKKTRVVMVLFLMLPSWAQVNIPAPRPRPTALGGIIAADNNANNPLY